MKDGGRNGRDPQAATGVRARDLSPSAVSSQLSRETTVPQLLHHGPGLLHLRSAVGGGRVLPALPRASQTAAHPPNLQRPHHLRRAAPAEPGLPRRGARPAPRAHRPLRALQLRPRPLRRVRPGPLRSAGLHPLARVQRHPAGPGSVCPSAVSSSCHLQPPATADYPPDDRPSEEQPAREPRHPRRSTPAAAGEPPPGPRGPIPGEEAPGVPPGAPSGATLLNALTVQLDVSYQSR